MGLLARNPKKRRYELKDVIGRGGFATVYEAYDRKLERRVAVKVSPRHRDSPAEHEERVGAGLAHPHLVKLLDAFHTWKHRYLVFELLEGPELFDRIVEVDRMTEADACLAAAALTKAVHYLHERGIIHRDIKPENVLYRSDKGAADDCVLADLGLSAILSASDPFAFAVGHAGSPGYCAPEMLIHRVAGRPADIWSLGLVVYAMLSGRTPFLSSGPMELHKESRRASICFPERYWGKVSPLAVDFVRRCLRRDPAARMTADEALQHPWILSCKKP